MLDTVVTSLADAFMQVGVFVALLLLGFGVLQWRTGGRITRFLAARWRTAPLVAAALGVSPGCGGAILVMPLYARGTVSFGSVVAALVATMGDASFVLIATNPRMALMIHGVLFVAGVVCGYAVDAAGITPPRPAGFAARGASTVGSAEAFPPLPTPAPTRIRARLVLLPALAAAAAVVAVPVTFQLIERERLAAVFGGFDPYLVFGVAGTAAAAAVTIVLRRGDDTCARGNFAAVLRDASAETGFVTVCVAGAYVFTELALSLAGIDLAVLLSATGILGVLAGALVGLIPGCAPQIILTGLYTAGGLPLPTLLANALSQDGDALFPLLGSDRRAAILASLVTVVPAILVGAVALALRV